MGCGASSAAQTKDGQAPDVQSVNDPLKEVLKPVAEGQELVFHKQYCFSDQRYYHAEQLLSFSERDFKVRDITMKKEVGFTEVSNPSNDHQYTPLWKVDTKEFAQLFGDDAGIFPYESGGKLPGEPNTQYYLKQNMFTNDYNCVEVLNSKDGQCLFTIVKIFFTTDQLFKVWKGAKTGQGDDDHIYTFRSNIMENQRLLKNRKNDILAVWYTDTVQLTKSFRFTVAPGFDTSFALAISAASRIMDLKGNR